MSKSKQGEAAGREKGELAGGGKEGNDLLEQDQPRGVDEEGRLETGTHGGPGAHEHRVEGADREEEESPRAAEPSEMPTRHVRGNDLRR